MRIKPLILAARVVVGWDDQLGLVMAVRRGDLPATPAACPVASHAGRAQSLEQAFGTRTGDAFFGSHGDLASQPLAPHKRKVTVAQPGVVLAVPDRASRLAAVSKKHPPRENWQDKPEPHDFPAASDYLSLLFPEPAVAGIVSELKEAATIYRKAKDLMRASRLSLLPVDDPDVAADLKKVKRGELLSPVLLVRGQAAAGLPLIVADGYHRICASYHLNENADIPCRVVELP